MHTARALVQSIPRLRGLRSAIANPLAGCDAGGLAKPVPRRLLENATRASKSACLVCPLTSNTASPPGCADCVPAFPITFTDPLPIALRGDTSVASMALALVGRQGIDARQSKVIEAMYRNTALSQAMNEGFAVRDQVQRTVQAEMDAASRNAIGTKGFALVARRMARLMRDRFDLGFVDVGGWHTHVGQGAELATGLTRARGAVSL